MASQKNQKRQYWMDLARIIASYFVIIIHLTDSMSVSSLTIKVILHCAVPLFIMISGTNFLAKDREITIKGMWKKYILPLLLTFVVWSMIYGVYNSYIYCRNDPFEMLKNVIINTVNGHYHMWYIWMTVSLYAVTVFIKKITDNSTNKELFYYIIIAYVYLSFRYLVQFEPFDVFLSAVTDMRLTFVMGFLIYYIGGLFLSRLQYSKKITLIMLVFGAACLVGNIAIVLFKIKPLEGGDGFGYASPFNIGFSFACYWFLSRFSEKFAQKHKKIISAISSLTLSVYLTHVAVIDLLNYFFHIKQLGVVYLFPLGIAVFLICIILALLFNLTNVTSRLFNGRKKTRIFGSPKTENG